jgi:hypothetical protein
MSVTEENPKELIALLNACIREGNAAGFVKLCQAAKDNAMALIHQNRCVDAGELMKAYGLFMESLRSIDPEFLLNILDVYPQNHASTLMLLGSNAQVDQAIISTKIDTQLPLPIAGSERLVVWAIKQKNLSYVEEVVGNIWVSLKYDYAGDDSIKRAVSDLFIEALAYRQKEPFLSSALLDDLISSMVTPRVNERLDGEVVGRLAKMHMPKTLMAMLEHGRLGTYLEKHNEDFEQVRACLPPLMTSRQLSAVHFYLAPKGLTEHIFFDESIDLDGYLQSMNEPSFKAHTGMALCIYSLKSFIEHITLENFARPAKKARIIKLLNAACEGEFTNGVPVKDIRSRFFYADVPEFTWKYVTRFKPLELEDALGL